MIGTPPFRTPFRSQSPPPDRSRIRNTQNYAPNFPVISRTWKKRTKIRESTALERKGRRESQTASEAAKPVNRSGAKSPPLLGFSRPCRGRRDCSLGKQWRSEWDSNSRYGAGSVARAEERHVGHQRRPRCVGTPGAAACACLRRRAHHVGDGAVAAVVAAVEHPEGYQLAPPRRRPGSGRCRRPVRASQAARAGIARCPTPCSARNHSRAPARRPVRGVPGQAASSTAPPLAGPAGPRPPGDLDRTWGIVRHFRR